MALSRNEPRRYKRPPDREEEVDDVIIPGTHGRQRPTVTHSAPVARPDKKRAELLRVLEIRGKPIRRDRGMRPSKEFERAAGAYIAGHHYNFCVKFARERSARHVPLDDLIQACLLGAYIALERFDPDHDTSYRFLSYAKWYLLCESNKLLHKDECLVAVPQAVKDARAALSRTAPDDLSDEEAAELLQVHVDTVRAARAAHLGHAHRGVDERSRVCRRSLGEVRALHDERAEELRQAAGLHDALAQLSPLCRRVLAREFGVGEDDGGPGPTTDQAHRAIRHLALRTLRGLLKEVVTPGEDGEDGEE